MVDRIGGPGTPRQPGQPEEIKGAAEAAGTPTPAARNAALQKFRPGDVESRGKAPAFSSGKDVEQMADILTEKAKAVRTLDEVHALLGHRISTPSGPTIGSVPYRQQIVLLQTVGVFMRFIEPAADRIKVMREILSTTKSMPDTVDRGPVLKLLPLVIKELDTKDQEAAFRLLSEDLNAAQRKNSINAPDYFVGLGGLIQAFEKTSPTFQQTHIRKLFADIAKLPPDRQAVALKLLGMKRFSLSDEIEPEVSRAIVLAWASDRFDDEDRATISDGLISGIATLRSEAAGDAAVMTLLDAAEGLPEIEQRKAFAQSLEPLMPTDETPQAYAAFVQRFDKALQTALNATDSSTRYQMLHNLATQIRDLSNVDTNGPLTNDRYLRYRQFCDVLLPVMRPYIKANQAVPPNIWRINGTLHNARDLLSAEENAAINAAIAAADLTPETR